MTENTDRIASFLSSASFQAPARIVESAWLQHAPFAFWLVEVMRPDVVVELGTHRGFSFFCFCEAAERAALTTRLYAVDTWQGDSQAGFYGEDVFDEVEAHRRAHHIERASLIRLRFDAALDKFADGSIDLLHIDGSHGYNDVRSDFESWLPKLSPRAVVLFHDIAVEREGFGVKRLWAELGTRYPHFAFDHGYGLGVLGVGPERTKAVDQLFSLMPAAPTTLAVCDAYARLGHTVQLDFDLRLGSCLLLSRQSTLELDNARLRQSPDELSTGSVVSSGEAMSWYSESSDGGRDATLRAALAVIASAMCQHDQADVRLASERERITMLSRDLACLEEERDQLAFTNATLVARLKQSEAAAACVDAMRIDAEAVTARLRRTSRLWLWSRVIRNQLDIFSLYRSPLFDSHWYAEAYLTRKTSRLAAVRHYLNDGFAEGCLPNRLFDSRWYLTHYDDVRRSGVNPLLHYLVEGWAEERNPGPDFDTLFYLRQNPDVAKSRMNPLVHYVRFGCKEGRLPAPLDGPGRDLRPASCREEQSVQDGE